MTEQPPRPVQQQFGERSGQGSWNPARTAAFITSLVPQQEPHGGQLHLSDVGMYNALLDLRTETHQEVPEALYDTIRHVTTAVGFLIYDKLSLTQQAQFLYGLRVYHKESGVDRLELTPEEGDILQRLAREVDITYDPGEPEKRTFLFADIEKKAPDPTKLPYE